MPKIIQICEVFDFSHQNSVACVGDDGRAYMLNRDRMEWEPLPDLPEEEKRTLYPGSRVLRDEMLRNESMRALVMLEYCSRCKHHQSLNCRYCEATEESPRPTRFEVDCPPEEPDFAAHAAVTLGVK
jgi:hypothetical protein